MMSKVILVQDDNLIGEYHSTLIGINKAIF